MPRVSIGIPVYNGQNYIEQTIESFLHQSLEDFEIIIADNASTDKTEKICRQYAEKDSRIRYVRNKNNIGAAPNFNKIFKLGRAPYFKWGHHDDRCAPTYLEKCIRILDYNPDVIISHPKTIIIDSQGNELSPHDDLLDLCDAHPHTRFRKYLFRRAGQWNAMWGVIRKDELQKTPLHGGYPGSDQILLGELILRGKVYQLSERLFYRRRHPQQSWKANPGTKAFAVWFDSANAGKFVMPVDWKLFLEYISVIKRVSISKKDKGMATLYMLRWGFSKLIKKPLRKQEIIQDFAATG